MTSAQFPIRLLLTASLLVASFLGASSVGGIASAQDQAVVQRLVQHGQMSLSEAREVVRRIDETMRANAERGGDAYDDLRQKVNRALLGANAGPGATRQEYVQRLEQTLARMRAGLDLPTLQVLFPSGRNAAVLCAHRWGVSMGECDALIAGATLTTTSLPYLAPDDGAELENTLRGSRVSRRMAREIRTKLRETMLGVPRTLTNNEDGRLMLELLRACPGGSSDREAQIRAWHIGPTEGMAQCIAAAVARRGGAATAARLFGFSQRTSEAFIRWGAAAAPPQPQVTQPQVTQPQVTRPQVTQPQVTQPQVTRPPQGNGTPQVVQMTDVQALRNQGAAFARAGRMPNAYSAYQAAVAADPNHAPTFAAFGAVQLALGDRAGAVTSYQTAVRLDATNADTFVGLGRALAGNGQNDAAIAALQQAMRLDYNNMSAREGLRALGGEAPLPPLPETPPRDAILGTMAPLRGALMGCDPQFNGRVIFRLTVLGATGEVMEISSEGEMSEDAGYCMESVVQSARFPRFTNENLNVTYPFQLGQ